MRCLIRKLHSDGATDALVKLADKYVLMEQKTHTPSVTPLKYLGLIARRLVLLVGRAAWSWRGAGGLEAGTASTRAQGTREPRCSSSSPQHGAPHWPEPLYLAQWLLQGAAHWKESLHCPVVIQ